MGQALADHSYVDLSTVGSDSDNSDSVVCHTDLSTCCSGGQGIHRGDWYFPDGTPLQFPFIWVVLLRELPSVVPLLLDQLVSIAAVLQ